MKVYIVRHGQPEGTELGKRFLGITDVPLTDKGMEQASWIGSVIAERESGNDIRIVSSPLIRCYETALVIKKHLKCGSPETDADLREIDMGTWNGRLFDEIRYKYPEEFLARGRDLWNYKVPEGECFAETGIRFRSAVDKLIEKTAPDEVIIIVSHIGAIRAGLYLMTDKPFSIWMKKKVPYASAFALEISDGNISSMKQIKKPEEYYEVNEN